MRSAVILLPVLALAGSAALHAGKIDAIYAFGDSLTDVGNAFIGTGGAVPQAPYFNGEFSNGPVWIQDLAISLGLAPLTPSLTGGTDYAVGGADTGVTPSNAGSPTDFVPGQIAAFQAAHPVADPNALYAIWIGSNDLRDINPAVAGATIAAAVSNIDSGINALASEGAKDFLVLGAPDIGLTPAAIALGPTGQAEASALAQAFNSALFGSLGPLAATDGVQITTLNTYSLIDGIVANPGAYGFTNVTQPCDATEVNYSGGASCAAPSQYLFWDTIHPTAAGQAIVAAAADAALAPEPSSLVFSVIGVLGLLVAGRRASSANLKP